MTKLPAVLKRPIDPTENIDKQADNRLKAIFSLYGESWPPAGGSQRVLGVLAGLILDHFAKAFEIRRPLPDKRLKVSNVAALRQLVDALLAGTEDQLPDPRLRVLGIKVRRWLKERGKKASQRNICEAISKLDVGQWKGIKRETLRDRLNRPLGKKAHAEAKRIKAENDRLCIALTRAIKQLGVGLPPNPDDDSIETPDW